jgi:hypothetical protein
MIARTEELFPEIVLVPSRDQTRKIGNLSDYMW